MAATGLPVFAASCHGTASAPQADAAPDQGSRADVVVSPDADSPRTDGAASPDAGPPLDAAAQGEDALPAPDAVPPLPDVAVPVGPDECPLLPDSTLTVCPADPEKASLAIVDPDGTTRYACAYKFVPLSSGWNFVAPSNTYVATADECCGAVADPRPFPDAPLTPAGFLGKPHSADHIKVQELENGRDGGGIKHNPFAVVLTDEASGHALMTLMPMWRSWSLHRETRMAPDGTGPFRFLGSIDWVMSQDAENNIVIVVGPEVYLPDNQRWGHPTLGACATRGTAMALNGGEIVGTVLDNNSGRFGVDPAGTEEALRNAAEVFKARGVDITAVKFN